MTKLRVQVNGRNFISQCGRLACVKERVNLVTGQKRWFAYRVGQHKPEHRFQSYKNAVKWLETLDGRGYITIDGVQVLRNWN